MDVITRTSGMDTTINNTNNYMMSTTLNRYSFSSTINNNGDDDNTWDLLAYKSCKDAYEASNKSKGLFLSMTHGVEACNYDTNQEPYK
jgi:hypothetical protein